MSDVLETIKRIEESYKTSRKIQEAMIAERNKMVDSIDGNCHPWIGKLCWFSDEEKNLGKTEIGVLKSFYKDALISGTRPYATYFRSYVFCRPVKESELKELLAKEQ